MIDGHQSFSLADTMLPRDRARLLPRRLRAVARWVLRAMHESRRHQAEAVLRRHAHLIESARARHAAPDGSADRAGGNER